GGGAARSWAGRAPPRPPQSAAGGRCPAARAGRGGRRGRETAPPRGCRWCGAWGVSSVSGTVVRPCHPDADRAPTSPRSALQQPEDRGLRGRAYRGHARIVDEEQEVVSRRGQPAVRRRRDLYGAAALHGRRQLDEALLEVDRVGD